MANGTCIVVDLPESSSFIFMFYLLETKPRALLMLDKGSTSELHP